MIDSPPLGGIQYFKIAREQSLLSDFRCKVGACLVIGKSVFSGRNINKTHPKYANPSKHLKTSLHAELSCFIKAGDNVNTAGSSIYVYRETKDGKPALARPCEHCMEFLRNAGIETIYYSTSEFPYWNKETI